MEEKRVFLVPDYSIGDSASPEYIDMRAYEIHDNDAILLKGGCVYGPICLEGKNNVSIGSYGTEPAIVYGGAGNGIEIKDCTYIDIWGLSVRGDGWRENQHGNGIQIIDSKDVKIKNVEAYGFRNAGIAVSAENVLIEGCFCRNNGFCGICSNNGEEYSRNLIIRHTKAYDNAGDPDIRENHSGSGIAIFHTIGALVEYCEAAGNGWAQRQRNINGPVGIWCACDCTDIVFRKNISHHNRTQPGGVDGDGFDIDGAVVDGYMEYNYSYENDGSGYLLCEYGSGMRWANNNMRYCISLNDAKRVQRQGGVQYYGPDPLELDGSVSEKSFFVPALNHFCVVNNEVGKSGYNIKIRDNIFVQGLMPSVSVADNPYTKLENNTVLTNSDLYWDIINSVPRLTNPRDLDHFPLLTRLKDGTLAKTLSQGNLTELIGSTLAPDTLPGTKLFTYYLDGKDFEGSDYQGDIRLTYDSIKPGIALRLTHAGTDIRLPIPGFHGENHYQAILTARPQSPDVQAYLYASDGTRIVAAVPVTGSVSSYHPIPLTFAGAAYVGLMVKGGESGILAQTIDLYELEANSVSSIASPSQTGLLSGFLCFGDVFVAGENVILNGKGSGIVSYRMADGDRIYLDIVLKTDSDGGCVFIQGENSKQSADIKKGENRYHLEMMEGNGFLKFGIFNTTIGEDDEIVIENINWKQEA